MNTSILYQTNRSRFIKNLIARIPKLKESIAVFAGSYRFHHYDTTSNYPLKVDQNFAYLFGVADFGYDGFIDLNDQKSYLVKTDESTKGYTSGSSPSIDQSNYQKMINKNNHYKGLTNDEAQARFGIHSILTNQAFLDFLDKKNPEKVYLNSGIDRFTGIEVNSFSPERLGEKYKEIIDYDTLYPVLNNSRTIKSHEEAEFMREICMISSRGHVEMMKNCKVGMFEYQMAAIFFVK